MIVRLAGKWDSVNSGICFFSFSIPGWPGGGGVVHVSTREAVKHSLLMQQRGREPTRVGMSAIPPKMAALFALASILCHLVALGLVVQTRVELSTVRGGTLDAQRRLLEFSDANALERMRDEMEAMRADKLRSDERVALLSSHVDSLDEELQATRKSERTQRPVSLAVPLLAISSNIEDICV